MAALRQLPSAAGLRVGVLEEDPRVGVLELARPQRANAIDAAMWEGLPKAISALEAVDSVRVILLCAQGSNFCSGIDKAYLQSMVETLRGYSCPGRAREYMRSHILQLQDAVSCLEKCKWPVVAAVQGSCIGGGVDIIAACDVRVCSSQATFCVKEVDLAITADLGSLQRLPHILGHGATADLALTARTIGSEEATRLGLVTQVIGGDQGSLLSCATRLARSMASKSPLALVGTKRVLLHNRDAGGGGVARELEHVATYNAAMLVSEDLLQLMAPGGGSRGGKPLTFSKL